MNSTGNENRDLSPHGHADDDDLIVAGATDINNAKSTFSDYGTYVDVWAPGSNVYTANVGGGYTSVSGTSFSCPLTAGLIALIWSANPGLTPDEVEKYLKQGTEGIYNSSPYGMINSFASLNLAGFGSRAVRLRIYLQRQSPSLRHCAQTLVPLFFLSQQNRPLPLNQSNLL